MRIDHIAYRVANKEKTAQYFIDIFGYKIDPKIPDGFDIQFEDDTSAKCLVLLPPENKVEGLEFKYDLPILMGDIVEYHMAPEIFISDGSDGSVVKEWVNKRDGVGGIHHIAYQVDSVEKIMNFMKEKGYAEFTTEKPLTCLGLTQIFTKPSELTGVIYEFIERKTQGFCKDNVKELMNSTKNV